MTENLFGGAFNGMMGTVEPGKLKLTMNGGIAVKCSNGYKTYNVEKGTLTNVSNFCFNVGMSVMRISLVTLKTKFLIVL